MKSTTEWSSPPVTPELARGEIHVWSVCLATDQATLQRLESTLADQEIGAARVEDLGISRSRGCRVAVEACGGKGQTGCWRDPKSCARCRERIASPAARQVSRPDIRTPERRVDKACRILADVKLVIEGDLTDPERSLAVEELLLEPQIVEAR